MHNGTTSPIVLPEAPAIPGLAFCRVRGVVDFPGVAAVMNASFAADRNGERFTPEGLAHAYAHPINWDPRQDTLYVQVAGTPIGYAHTEWRDEDNGCCLHWIHLYLLPEWRGQGLELAMHSHMERRARETAAAGPHGAQHLFDSMVPETWPARAEMLLARGYAAARCFFEMQRPLDDDLPIVDLPVGLVFRPPLPVHYRAIWEANVETNRDNWGHVEPTTESYRAWVESPDLDPSLWRVAWDGDQVAGAAINVVHEDNWGETDDLFVRHPWRKRGLGRALLASTLHLFKARGLVTAGLGVDADNLSGALRLYESVGYRVYQRVVLYRKPA
jgi:mycothiol synthase